MTWLEWKSVKPKKSPCWYHWGNRHQQFDWCWWQFQYRRPSNSFQYAWSNSCSSTSRSIHCSDPNWNHDNNQQLHGCFLGFGNCFPRYGSYWNKTLFDNSDLMHNEIELSNFAAVYNDFASAVTQLDSAFGNQILGSSTNAFLRIVWKKIWIFPWALGQQGKGPIGTRTVLGRPVPSLGSLGRKF